MDEDLDFDRLVERFYQPLYQFALSLTRSEADACDLVQHTYLVWAKKGGQLRDPAKVKSWLFTALHRRFLEGRRHDTRFPHDEISQTESELPAVSPPRPESFDTGVAIDALSRIDEVFRAPVALFYLEDYSYQEIAHILSIPLGTVKSRISRGVRQLQAGINARIGIKPGVKSPQPRD